MTTRYFAQFPERKVTNPAKKSPAPGGTPLQKLAGPAGWPKGTTVANSVFARVKKGR
jgi:hypothetical protein